MTKNKRDIGQEILDGVRVIKAHKAGKIQLRTRKISDPSPAREIRLKLNLSQHAFAGMLGVSVRTVQDWEQKRRLPRGPAKVLLRVAEQNPEALLELR